MAEMLNYAADVDIIEAEVCKAIGEPIPVVHEPNYNGYYAILVLHNESAGVFDHLEIYEAFRNKYVIEEEVRVKKGDRVVPFSGANNAIGTLFLKFDSQAELEKIMNSYRSYVKVILQPQ